MNSGRGSCLRTISKHVCRASPTSCPSTIVLMTLKFVGVAMPMRARCHATLTFSNFMPFGPMTAGMGVQNAKPILTAC